MTPTTTVPTLAPTAAAAFASNPIVEESIQRIVSALREAQRSITGARPPRAELKETYKSYLDRVAAAKGKPALFPYVGSGVGNGPLVELADGSVKWDLINGIGVHMFGHSEPDLVATALRAACGDTVMQGNLQFNHDSTEFAELLLKEAARSSRIKHAFISNSGAMANESALKVCFQRNAPASRVIAFENCFMGRSTTLAQIGDSAAGRVGVPLNVLVDYMPFYDSKLGQASIEAAKYRLRQYIDRYPGQHACFIVEPVQGEGGFNIAPREFLIPLLQMAREAGIGIWFDEVQSFGRTETMFHFEQLGLGEYVDVVTLGKMSQACACLFTEEYAPKPGLLSGTFVASTVALNVGRRILERLRDGGYYGANGKIAKLQQAYRTHASALIEKHPEWFPPVPHYAGGSYPKSDLVTGVGGMMRLTPFGGDKAKVNRLMHVLFEEGVISFYCGHGPFHLRFLAPIGVMQPEHFNEVFEIVERAMARVAAE
ncbi:MAG TPA: aminotransferase class III-fold pyridoxal phosphate-dependent enzyme [Phycisphaerales bacterium]|nr:aminotransferase class III-fold pyridoxal phosphate-dependent enzyme [Phycisphaerales bacterium]HRQ75414.1 aminotransferase class III-fold pyridoxal phosphate-dependent enzyme [Phycisphaerales bacterium]